MEHEITVAKLGELLAKLRDDDILVPNSVANLTIVREGRYLGFIDLLKDHQRIDLSDPT